MVGQDLCVAVSEGMQESGGALDVREKKCDPARRKICMRRRLEHKPPRLPYKRR